ncbi:MAG: hypothetical protein ACLRIL_01735 [Fusicatenibacter saccharivorans]
MGADKQCDYFRDWTKRTILHWGCRAIRICLTRPEIFKTQLACAVPRQRIRQYRHYVSDDYKRR